MKVFILMDSTNKTGRESIIGVFETLEKAKLELADYVLEELTDTIEPYYVDIYEVEVKKWKNFISKKVDITKSEWKLKR